MREHLHDDETVHAQRSITIAPRESVRKPERQILDLQRTMGNTAVTQAVHSGRLADLGVHSQASVQRKEDDTEEADDEEEFDGAEVAGNVTDDEETFDGAEAPAESTAETVDEASDADKLSTDQAEGASPEELLADQIKVATDKSEEAEEEGED